ncbi:zinc-dependent metalloprotease [Tamlana sp. I1]|uniref:zinc-dependent metalloprotease n=1 Tax=Tamlana sp. I1 TaxID=2762061 RepID=UPI001890B286|nr:T9SS type A sorting domain-containing protein [Tamlana sp. I1]
MVINLTCYKAFFTVVFFSLILSLSSHAQVLLREIPLEQQVEKSNVVVEGKVVSKKSFWGSDGNIYTANTVAVYKVFKGETTSLIDIVTQGGTIGFDYQMVTHSLQLKRDDLGVFTLVEHSESSKSGNQIKHYKVYSGLQGFYKYNLHNDVVSNPFYSQEGISSAFYKQISNYTKSAFIAVKNFNVVDAISKISQSKSVLVPTEITFAPTTVSAGTKSTITISIPNGATGNFGNTQGKVSFRNADSGGQDKMGVPDYIDALETQILNWTPTSITVEVPDNAGNGNIRVTDSNSNIIDSTADLAITYALLNVVFDIEVSGVTKDYAFATRHVNNDGSGGYKWQMETSFDADVEHAGAKAAYLSALGTWRCETGVNFTIGAVTSIDKAEFDGVNVIRFDNGAELPDGTIGQTSYSFSACGTSLDNIQAFPTEIDMVFDDETNWYFGDGLPGFRVDFQSVALHELGHAHQLGHVIQEIDDVMHYSISLGAQKRVLTVENITAAEIVQSKSESSVPTSSCFSGKSPMTHYNCQLSTEDFSANHKLKLYPNPTNGLLYIQSGGLIDLEYVVVSDVSGRIMFENKVSNLSNPVVIDLTSFSKGVYFIQISAKSGALTKKIILE